MDRCECNLGMYAKLAEQWKPIQMALGPLRGEAGVGLHTPLGCKPLKDVLMQVLERLEENASTLYSRSGK